MAGRARGPPRVAAARARDPVSGLSVRAGRSLPQARAGPAGDRGARVRRHRDVRRAVGRVRAIRAASIPGRSACWSRCGSATALLYPALRRATAWFVDTVVLRRPDYASLRATIARRVQTHDDVPRLLVGGVRAARAGAERRVVTWREWRHATRTTHSARPWSWVVRPRRSCGDGLTVVRLPTPR